MYQIDVDQTNKIISVELSGSLEKEEIQAYTNDLAEIFGRYQEKELSVLASATRLDPVSQDCLHEVMVVMGLILLKAKKVAAIHSRFITQMQMRRMEETIHTQYDSNTKIMRFKTKREALDYLKQ